MTKSQGIRLLDSDFNRPEIVSADLLEGVVHSEEFRRGLKRAIETTVETRKETGFVVRKRWFCDEVVFPPWINIGDAHRVNPLIPDKAGYGEAIAEWPIDETELWWESLTKRLPEGYDSLGSYLRMYYPLLTIHVEPSLIQVPSPQDILALNNTKKLYRFSLSSDRDTRVLALFPRPISVRVGVSPGIAQINSKIHEDYIADLYFYQFKDCLPHTIDQLSEAAKELSLVVNEAYSIPKAYWVMFRQKNLNHQLRYWNLGHYDFRMPGGRFETASPPDSIKDLDFAHFEYIAEPAYKEIIRREICGLSFAA